MKQNRFPFSYSALIHRFTNRSKFCKLFLCFRLTFIQQFDVLKF